MTNAPSSHIRLAGETSRQTFELVPDAEMRAKIGNDLDLRALKKLRFEGSVQPDGDTDWRLEGALGATIVQDCVVTFEPVTTRIDRPVIRRFVKDMPDIGIAAEVEMPEDDTLEPLAPSIDLARILTEELALALPDFPRADGVEPVDVSVTEPGKKPMTDAEAKPFAGLAGLKKSLEDKDNSGG